MPFDRQLLTAVLRQADRVICVICRSHSLSGSTLWPCCEVQRDGAGSEIPEALPTGGADGARRVQVLLVTHRHFEG